MSFLERFYPDLSEKSVYEISFEKWYQKGFRGIIFDIDNTLVPHGAPADEQSKTLFRKLHKMGFHTMLISNNQEPRVLPFAKAVGAPYIYNAGKPSTKAYYEAMERIGTRAETTLFIGDQLFTDIWGAKRAGILTIRVEPIHPKEEIQIVLKRQLEKIVLHFYNKQRRNS
jgi:HAD superfamily phosphatase (TIGR01668 family)